MPEITSENYEMRGSGRLGYQGKDLMWDSLKYPTKAYVPVVIHLDMIERDGFELTQVIYDGNVKNPYVPVAGLNYTMVMIARNTRLEDPSSASVEDWELVSPKTHNLIYVLEDVNGQQRHFKLDIHFNQ